MGVVTRSRAKQEAKKRTRIKTLLKNQGVPKFCEKHGTGYWNACGSCSDEAAEALTRITRTLGGQT